MTDHIWATNPDWQRLDPPEERDIVQLKHADGLNHLVKVIALSVTDDEVTGEVQAVFDWDTKRQILGGDILSLVGKHLTFPKDMIHNVTKKQKHLK